MSPLFMRIFTLVGMALAAASMQMKARAETLTAAQVQQVQQVQAVVTAQFQACLDEDTAANGRRTA